MINRIKKIPKRILIEMFALLVILTILMVYLYYSNIYFWLGQDITNNEGLCFFYDILNPHLYLWVTVIIISLPSNIICRKYVDYRINKFDLLLKSRQGFKKYVINNYINSFIYSLLVIFLVYIYMLFFIHFFLTPINFTYSDYVATTNMTINIFSKNTFLNLAYYICFSSIGFSIYNTLIMSVKNIFKQRYFFRISSILLGVLLTVLPVLFASRLFDIFNNTLILQLISLITLPTLMSPGIQSFGGYGIILPPIIGFFGSAILYGIIIFICFIKQFKREYKYEI